MNGSAFAEQKSGVASPECHKRNVCIVMTDIADAPGITPKPVPVGDLRGAFVLQLQNTRYGFRSLRCRSSVVERPDPLHGLDD